MAYAIELSGKVAIVTGGSRGLGLAIVEGLADAGARIAVVSRKIEVCEQVAVKLRAQGVDARAYACHVGRWDEIEPFVDRVYADFGRIDILVNNAGMSPTYSALDEISESYFDSVIGVNFKGPFRLMALVGARMRRDGGGSIVNISSVGSLLPAPHALPYGAAKAALNAMTESFAAALAPAVRVNTLCVGPFATDVAQHWSDPPDPDRPGWSRDGQRIGRPSEAVGAVLYFASDLASFTNGTLLRVDGGPPWTYLRAARTQEPYLDRSQIPAAN